MLKTIPLLALVALGGCASAAVMRSVPIATMSRLASLDLSKISPSQLRVAARLPAGLEPQPGGATVQLQWKAGSAGDKLNFVLEQETAPDETGRLSRYDLAGARIWLFRLSAPDVARLEAARSRALDTRATVALSISAGVAACHSGGLPTGALLTTTYLRTDGSDYFPLSENLDLRAVVSAQDLASKVPPCR